jgi:hypothetical protein
MTSGARKGVLSIGDTNRVQSAAAGFIFLVAGIRDQELGKLGLVLITGRVSYDNGRERAA